MDDLILAGALSILALYAGTILAITAVILGSWEVLSAAMSDEPGRAGQILGTGLVILAAYAGTGLWLQKSGRI